MNNPDSCLNFNEPIRDAISRIRFAPFTNNNLLISSWDSNLRLYDVDKCELRLECCDEEPLLDCCFEDESFALAVGANGSVCRFDMHLGTRKTIGNHDSSATCIEYSEDTHQTITAAWDKKLKCWDARLSTPIGCLSDLDIEVDSMTLSGFSLMVAVRSSVYIYDLRSFRDSVEAKESYMDVPLKCVRSIASVEGFAVGSFDGRVGLEYLCQSNKTKESYMFRCHPKERDGRKYLVAVNDITFNPSVYGVFVSGDNEGQATVWDALSKKRLLELPKYADSVASLAYNHDGQLLAVASSYTYQEVNKREQWPQIFIHQMDDFNLRLTCPSSSKSEVPQTR